MGQIGDGARIVSGQWIRFLVGTLFVAILIGCSTPPSIPSIDIAPNKAAGPADATATEAGPTVTREETRVMSQPTPQPSPPAGPAARAVADLARRLGINANSIQVVSFEAVTWPDSSLGCPQPGLQYAEALVEGYLVKLRAGDKVYEYHGAGTSPPILCNQAP